MLQNLERRPSVNYFTSLLNLESTIIQNIDNYKNILLEHPSGLSKNNSFDIKSKQRKMLKSDGFSKYNQNRGMIKFDAMKHLHKKSIHQYESANVNPKTSHSSIRMHKSFHQNIDTGYSTRYSQKSNNDYFGKVDIFKKKKSIGLINTNKNKKELDSSFRRHDKFNATILDNEHDMSSAAENLYNDVKMPYRPIKRLDIRNSYHGDQIG